MNILCYQYEADYHCIKCTGTKLIKIAQQKRKDNITSETSIYTEVDKEGNPIHEVFTTDEWYELDESYLSENPIQYLVCGSCRVIIDTYQEAMFQII